MDEIRKIISLTKDFSDSVILLIFLILTGFGIFFIYLILYFLCSLFNSPSIDEDELRQLRKRKNRMKKAFTNSILRRDVIVEMEENKPKCSREIYTCTTYKPVIQTDECIYPQSPIKGNLLSLSEDHCEFKRNSNPNSILIQA